MRALIFGIVLNMPIAIMHFVLDYPMKLKTLVLCFMGLGLLDLVIFVCYHDKINEMLARGGARRTPKGCAEHSNISFFLSFPLLACLFFLLFEFYACQMYQNNIWEVTYMILNISLYLLALCSLNMMRCYFVLFSIVVWVVMASFALLCSFCLLICTCGKAKIKAAKSYWEERTRVLRPLEAVKLRKEHGGEFNCSVCLDELIGGREVLDLPCNEKAHHFFHLKCGRQWLE